jgi:hypothetical protein
LADMSSCRVILQGGKNLKFKSSNEERRVNPAFSFITLAEPSTDFAGQSYTSFVCLIYDVYLEKFLVAIGSNAGVREQTLKCLWRSVARIGQHIDHTRSSSRKTAKLLSCRCGL